MSSKVLNNPIFPVHPNTFQGIATAETLSDKPFKAVHADEAGDVTVTFESGDITLALGIAEDVSVAGAVSVTSTTSIKVS